MRNLLPEQAKRRLQRTYRLRLLVVGLFLLSLALFAGTVVLTPSYLLSRGYERAAEDRAAVLERGSTLFEEDTSFKELRRMQAELALLSELKDRGLFSERIVSVLEHRTEGVGLSAFFYSAYPDPGSMLILSGTARSREALLEFERRLKSESGFVSVTLPVSSLAKESDISFSITVESEP